MKKQVKPFYLSIVKNGSFYYWAGFNPNGSGFVMVEDRLKAIAMTEARATQAQSEYNRLQSEHKLDIYKKDSQEQPNLFRKAL